MNSKCRALLLATMLALNGTAYSQPARIDLQSCAPPNLREIKRAFETDMKKKDLRVLGLYTPDADFTNPDGTTITGSAPLRNLFVHVFKTFDSDLHLRDGEILSSMQGDCLDEGVFTERLRDRASGKVTLAKGKYRFSYQRAGHGKWRFRSMAWQQPTRPE
jgi:ketosteroid isomerase-like protein